MLMENTNPETDVEMILLPKPDVEEKKDRVNVWVKSISSLALYLLAGYFFFPDWIILLIITGIIVIHELGHFLAMKFFNYKDLGIFFIPLLGAYASGSKQEVSQKQSAIILLAGPMPGIIAGTVIFILNDYRPDTVEQIYTEIAASLMVYLNMLNLIPVYPLDGGQLLNRLILDENKILSRIFLLLSVAVLLYLAWKINWILALFPVMLLFRLKGDIEMDRVVKKIEDEGVNLETTYEEISDEEYWKIRNAVIKHYPQLHDINPVPPYTYAPDEARVVMIMKSLLQRTFVMDVSLAGKILVLLFWVAGFLVPVLLQITFPFRFNF
jgi:membrane-associated protease RseP (regulator of RpoE activity)